MKKRYVTIKKTDNGERLDKILPLYLKDISRGQARKLIAAGAVSIDGARTRNNSRKIKYTQTITVYLDLLRESFDEVLIPEVLHNDKWFLVVIKPSGMPSDETKQGVEGTVFHVLKTHFNYSYLQLVHRLDMDTSGVMVLSKTPAATKELNRQFRERLVEKQYFTLVQGYPEPPDDTIETYLIRDPEDPRKFVSHPSEGKKSISRYRTLERQDDRTLLEVEILTGRTHQIRVHMSERGHPVIGDRYYSNTSNSSGSRLMLHAGTLTFNCPRTGERMTFRSPMPAEFNCD